MTLLQWDESYSVGIKEFDEHHKELLVHIHNLNNAIRQRQSQKLITGLLNKLEDYANFHFSAEEYYMTKYNYPQFDEQKKQHNLFFSKIDEYKHAVATEQLSLIVLGFLNNWYLGHISNVDKQYQKFFNRLGIK